MLRQGAIVKPSKILHVHENVSPCGAEAGRSGSLDSLPSIVISLSCDATIWLADILALRDDDKTSNVKVLRDEIDGSLSIVTVTPTLYVVDARRIHLGIYNWACGFKYAFSIGGPDNCSHANRILSVFTGQFEKAAEARMRTAFELTVVRLAGSNVIDGPALLFLYIESHLPI